MGFNLPVTVRLLNENMETCVFEEDYAPKFVLTSPDGEVLQTVKCAINGEGKFTQGKLTRAEKATLPATHTHCSTWRSL